MIQAPGGPCYAVRFITGAALGARLPRLVQSAAAEDLLGDLRRLTDGAGASSKSHARACVAAGLAFEGPVGIDVEYRAPGRPIEAIAHYLMGTHAPDETGAYRVFTFREAYFKALGDWPARDALQIAATATADRYRIGDLNVLHEEISPEFLLTLVWRGGGEAVRLLD